MQSAAQAIARIAAQRQQPWPRLQQCIWTQPVCSRVAVPLGAPSSRSSQRSAAASVLPGTATSATARFYSGTGGAGSAGSLERQIRAAAASIEEQEALIDKEAGRLLMVEEALTKEGVPGTNPRWQILVSKEQGLAAKKQGLAADRQGLAAKQQRLADLQKEKILDRTETKVLQRDLDIIKVKLEAMMGGRSGPSFKYSSAHDQGGHIVKQFLPYSPRPVDATAIVRRLQERRSTRAKDANKEDKMCNPLVALPAAPGSGKSTFLAHFPTSPEWQEFGGEGAAIVSTLTWNSGMSGGPVSFGLRIIYGAVRGMGLATTKWLQWSEDMEATVPNAAMLSANDAVSLLRQLFGHHRPVLLLVDELAKSASFATECGWGPEFTNDARVMTELGGLLDRDCDFHAVVSSLQPAYIRDLVSGSQRMVDYVVLTQLLDANLGSEEISKWAIQLIPSERSEPKPFPFVVNILSSSHMLMAAHPRSMEHFVKAVQTKPDAWQNLRLLLQKGGAKKGEARATVSEVLKELVVSLSNTTPFFQDPSLKIFEDFVLSSESTLAHSVEGRGVDLRKAIEVGDLILVDDGRDRASGWFLAGIPGFAVILGLNKCALAIAKEQPLGALCTAAGILFEGILINPQKMDIAELFERAVDMTIVSRSAGGHLYNLSLFGTEPGHGRMPYADFGKVVVRRASKISKVNQCVLDDEISKVNQCELFVPPEEHPGYDSRVTFSHTSPENLPTGARPFVFVYVQAKCATPKKQKAEVYAKTIYHILNEHSRLHLSKLEKVEPDDLQRAFSAVHIIMYNWGDKDLGAPAKKAIQQILERWIKDGTKSEPHALAFVNSRYFSSNLRTVGRLELEAWLIPSLRVFPRLVEAAEGETKK